MIGKIINIMKNPLVTGTYIIALFAVCFYYIYDKRQDFSGLLEQAMPEFILLAFSFYVLNYFLGILLSQKIYQILGVRISYSQMLKIFSISRIGRYMPGKIWHASNYYIFSKKLGIDSLTIAKNYIILNALSIITALICSLPAMLFVSMPLKVSKISLVFLAFILLVSIHPKILNFFFKKVEYFMGRFKGQGQYDQILNSSAVPVKYLSILSLGFLLNWMLSGVVLFFILAAFQSASFENYPVYLSAVAFSKLIGFLALFAPGGIGVRESIAVIILSPVIAMNIAMTAMVSLRILQIINDLIFCLIGFLPIRIWNALKERLLVLIILLKLVYMKIIMLFDRLTNMYLSIYRHSNLCNDNKKITSYMKKNFRNIFSFSEDSVLRVIRCKQLSGSSCSTFIVKITVDEPAVGIIKKKFVAKHYGLRGVYLRTKVSLLRYGRQALKIHRVSYSNVAMKAEIKANKILERSNVNMPGILWVDIENKYIFSEHIDGKSVDEIIHDIFYKKERIEDHELQLFQKMGMILAELHGKYNIVHSDAYQPNWIYDQENGKIFLIDWESVVWNGDPSFDLAHLIFNIGADAEELSEKQIILFDEIIKAILKGYNQSDIINDNIKRIVNYLDYWILYTSPRIQKRIFRILNVQHPASFSIFNKMPIPISNPHPFKVKKRSSTLKHRLAKSILIFYRIWFILVGKNVRGYYLKNIQPS